MIHSDRTTVVIITHNYARYLKTAVESVLEQTLRPNILIVDDASQDETSQVVEELRTEWPGSFDYFRTDTNHGLARIRNLAAQLVATEWIVYLDADDWLATDFIEKGEEWLDRHAGADVLTTDMFIVRDGSDPIVRKADEPLTWFDLRRRNGVVQTSFIKRNWIPRLGGYDPGLDFEDWDFWIRLVKNGGRIRRLPGPHVYRREHGGNKSKICDESGATRQVREKHPAGIAATLAAYLWRRRAHSGLGMAGWILVRFVIVVPLLGAAGL